MLARDEVTQYKPPAQRPFFRALQADRYERRRSIDGDTLRLADVYRDMGKNPDRTGDFAAGRTHFHETGEEFLACLDSRPYEPVGQ